MRTKSILLGAAVLAAGVASSFAQTNVYSINVVGYMNIGISNGYNLVANQLDYDGTNNINTILPVMPDGCQLLQWNPAIQNFAPVVQYYVAGNGWYDGSFNPATNRLTPGIGAFIYNPNPGTTVTIAGQVTQGTNVTTVNGIYGFYSTIAPIASSLDTNGFPAQDGMQYFTFVNGNYTPAVQYYVAGNGWYDGSFVQQHPTPQPGQGFVIYNPLATSYPWTQSFTVH